jgi:hypothetical protein
MTENSEIVQYATPNEITRRQKFAQQIRNCPIPDLELVDNLGLFLNSKTVARLKFMDCIYQQILEVPGIVMEFGTRWGQNLSHFAALRGIYEPFNRHRRLIGFDTFSGFAGISAEDGSSKMMKKGNYTVSESYEDFLEGVLAFQEQENPLAHIKKFELIKGDATLTLSRYLSEHPETIVALGYFDFDLYGPTKKCLELIRPRLTRGSVLGFDELNDSDAPGETIALLETFGINNVRLKRLAHTSRCAYFVCE